jgi:hypothetical protein
MWELTSRGTKATFARFYERSTLPFLPCNPAALRRQPATSNVCRSELPNFSKFKVVSNARPGPSYLRVRQRGNTSRKHLRAKGNNCRKGPRVEVDTNLVTLCSSKYFARSASSMSKILFSQIPLKGINTAPGSFLSTHSFILINLF